MKGFLVSGIKNECLGCEACAQICTHKAIAMQVDEEGFRYPVVNTELCVNCGLCNKVCPIENAPQKHEGHPFTYGGHINDDKALVESTSGGAFSAIVNAWAEQGNWVAFGAKSEGLDVYHTYVDNLSDLSIIRKSKYSQSKIGDSYIKVKLFLKEGKRVLFAGTPCQIAGLKNSLGKADTSNLLTVEVICEGVPSPLYVQKMDKYISEKYGSSISDLDYRNKAKTPLGSPIKWDFQVMQASLRSGRILRKDRWFNPFWSIWLKHLMSRPSCYECPFATQQRVADITLGDLWGVHLYCPELYNKNKGASLIICNSNIGEKVVKKAKEYMKGHELKFEDALRYQGPMRKHIEINPLRDEYMKDLMDPTLSYKDLTEKWATPPSLKLLWSKYVWGNRQRVALYNLKKRMKW